MIRSFVTCYRPCITDSWFHGLTLPNCEVMLKLLTNDRMKLVATVTLK
jgi:hypothetical protein